jgi:DNA-binding response OmpR family regulator
MHVLIVQPSSELATLWQGHLERQGATVDVAHTQEQAIHVLQTAAEINVVVLDLVLETGSAFAVAEMASYRQPKAWVIFVTSTTFFSDGSIFRHIPNACAFIRAETPPDDLVAIVEHYGVN